MVFDINYSRGSPMQIFVCVNTVCAPHKGTISESRKGTVRVFSRNVWIGFCKGPFKKYVTGLWGEGSSKIVTTGDEKGGGSSKTVMSPLIPEKILLLYCKTSHFKV